MIKEGLLQQRKGVLGLNNVNFPTHKKTCHQIWFSIRLLEVFFTLNYLFDKNVRNKEQQGKSSKIKLIIFAEGSAKRGGYPFAENSPKIIKLIFEAFPKGRGKKKELNME